MAGDQIKNSDLFAPDLFDTTKPEKYLETIELVELGLKELLNTSKNLLATNPFINSKNISDYAKIMKESVVLEQQLLKVEAEKTKALQQLEILAQKQIKTTVDKQKAEERYNDAIDKTTKRTTAQAREQAKLNSEYAQATAELNKMAKRQMDNVIAGREMSKTAKLVAEAHGELKIKVEKAEQSVGRFQRNVGNYKSGFDGLGNSINQLTREMPAFANSVQTGFMALSNNIPMFFDELKRANAEIKTLREQGENVPSLLSRFTTSLFSWGTALSAGVTLLTFFGKEIGQFVVNIFKADDAVKLSAETQSQYWTSLKKIIDRVTEAQLKYNVAAGHMTSTQADAFRIEKKKDAEIVAANLEFQANKKELAAKIGINPDLMTGKLDTSSNAKFSNEEMASAGKKNASNPFEQALKNRIAANAAVALEESKLRVKIANINKEASLEEAELFRKKADESKEEREKSEKAILDTTEKNNKKKEYVLDDMDKRILEKMEKKEEKKMKAEENLKKWTIESQEEQTKNELQNIKTVSDATIEAHNVDVENIDKTQKANEDAAKKDKLRREQELNDTINFANQINQVHNNRLEKQLDNDLAMRQRNIEQQQQLAIAGRDNTLAFEKAAAAKDELEKQKLAKKAEKQAKALLFLKLMASYAEKGDTDQAVTKTLVQMAIAGAVIGSYKDGVEGLEGPGTETSDSILARLSKNESVVTAKATREHKGLPTAMNEGKVDEYFKEKYLPKYLTDGDTGSFSENTVNAILLNKFTQLNNEISDIKKALKERPVQQTNLSNLGDVIDTRIVNGFKKQTIKKGNSPLNYI